MTPEFYRRPNENSRGAVQVRYLPQRIFAGLKVKDMKSLNREHKAHYNQKINKIRAMKCLAHTRSNISISMTLTYTRIMGER